MKRKILYVAAMTVMLILTAGCGGTQKEEKTGKRTGDTIPPTVTSAVVPAATVTPEPTVTLTPTPTPIPKNYMEKKGIRVLGAGCHEYQGFICEEYDEEGSPVLEIGTCEGIFEVTEEDNGDGTKTIVASIHVAPYVFEYGWMSYAMSGFVDLETGKSFFPYDADYAHTTYLRRDDINYELTLTCEMDYVSVTNPYNTMKYTLVCPSDYEDAAFYLTGYNGDWDTFIERAGSWKLLQFLKHGTSEIIVFSVADGLATMPTNALQEKVVRGVVQNTENYFEVNGLSIRGEGETVYRGTELTFHEDVEDFYGDEVLIETKELSVEFRRTEELLEDGRKQIRGSFTDTSPNSITDGMVKCVVGLGGVVDKKTGLSYCPRSVILADPVVLDKGEEEVPMMIAYEESMTEDGRYVLTYVVTCPQDYEDIVFYITGNYMDKELQERRRGHWLPISEVEHGESDMVFFQ